MSRHPDQHPELKRLFETAASGDPGRLAAAEHVRSCAECRVAVAERDPSRLFALLAAVPIPDGLLDRVTDGVRQAVDRLEQEPRSTDRRPWMPRLGSIAASLLLAGLFGAYLWSERIEPVAPHVTTPTADVVHAGASAGPGTTTIVPAGVIELLSSPGTANVLDLSVGETQLVMIFDENLDI